MPWQHLLQFVRKYRTPLVIADQPDEEALVVLPLRVYEELMEREEGMPPLSRSNVSLPSLKQEKEPVIHVPIEQRDRQPSLKDVMNVPFSLPEEQERDEEPSIPLFESRMSSSTPHLSSSPNLFSPSSLEEGKRDGLELEERFYLEPTDEDESIA